MNTYCLKCKKDTANIDPKMVKTKNNRLLMQSKCSVCGTKKSRFVNEQDAKGLLSKFEVYKMNEIINKFLLAGDKFMPEMHLRQPGFTYSVCGPFTKNKERIKNFMHSGNIDFIYKNELDKACFQHDMAYGKSKDLVKKTQSDKVLKDKAFKIASNPKYDGYQRGLASMLYKFFDKMSKGTGITNEFNYQLANELPKPIIKKLKKKKSVCFF